MKLFTGSKRLIWPIILSLPVYAQIDGTYFVRTGLISYTGRYSPEDGLTTTVSGGSAAYRRVTPTDETGKGNTGDVERWKRFSEAIQDPDELSKGHTLEVTAEGKTPYRIRLDVRGGDHSPNLSWYCWIPEDLEVKSLRLFKRDVCLGEVITKDSGFVPDAELRCDQGVLSWRVSGRTVVDQIAGSKDGGKTWQVFGHNTEKSISVDLSSSPHWIFAIEYMNWEDGRFHRKEIQVSR